MISRAKLSASFLISVAAFACVMIAILSIKGCQTGRDITDALMTIDTSDALNRVKSADFYTEEDQIIIDKNLMIIAEQDAKLRLLLATKTLQEIITEGDELNNIVLSLRSSVTDTKEVVDNYWNLYSEDDRQVLSAYYAKAKTASQAYDTMLMDAATLGNALEVLRLTMSVSAAL